jgi:hypothetical protein
MQKHLRMGIAAYSLLIVTAARADQITSLQLFDGSAAPTATINFTNADGTGSNTQYVYADPQVSGGTTSPLFYCVDLWHDNTLYQDLVSDAPGGVNTTTAVPEPRSFVIASVSILFFVVMHWWRRIV